MDSCKFCNNIRGFLCVDVLFFKEMKISCISWVFNNVGPAASQTYLMPTFSDSKPKSKLKINSPKLKLIDLFTNKYILFTYNSGGRKVSDRRIELKKNHSDWQIIIHLKSYTGQIIYFLVSINFRLRGLYQEKRLIYQAKSLMTLYKQFSRYHIHLSFID